MKHPTPWTIRDGLIWDAQGALVTDEDERIVACVNACEGVDTENLSHGMLWARICEIRDMVFEDRWPGHLTAKLMRENSEMKATLGMLQRFVDSVQVKEHNVVIIAPNLVRLAEEARALLKEIRG